MLVKALSEEKTVNGKQENESDDVDDINNLGYGTFVNDLVKTDA